MGLTAAIRLKQLDADLQVVVLEKGSEVGAHILSGGVGPKGLTRLIPDWKEKRCPSKRCGERGQFLYPWRGKIRLPNWFMPPLMNNHGNHIVSMGNVCRWLAEQAEELGVEIFPAWPVQISWKPVRLKAWLPANLGKSDGTLSDGYEPGMELHGKYVFLSEGGADRCQNRF